MQQKLQNLKSKLKEWCSKHDTLIFAIIVTIGLAITLLLASIPDEIKENQNNNDTPIVETTNTRVLKGANLLADTNDNYMQYNLNYVPYTSISSSVSNGITYTNNFDGSFTLNGVSTDRSQFRISSSYQLKANTTYTFFLKEISSIFGVACFLQLNYLSGSIFVDLVGNSISLLVFTTSSNVDFIFSFDVRYADISLENFVIFPCLYEGSYSRDNLPFVQPNLEYIYNQGYENGKTDGYNNGYNVGYEQGKQDGAITSGNFTSILKNSLTQVFTIENDSSSSQDNFSTWFDNSTNTITNLKTQLSTLYEEIGLEDNSNTQFRWKIYLPYEIPISLFYFTFSNWNISEGMYINFYSSNNLTNAITYRLQDFQENVFYVENDFTFSLVEFIMAPNNLTSYSSITFTNQEYYQGFYEGYDEGFNNGNTTGYNQGYENGKTDGYNNGYNVGYDEGANSGNVVGDALLSIADIPFSILSSMFGFQIFGFNVLTLITGVLTIGLVIWLLKKFF